MSRVAPLLAAALVATVVSRATFASPDPPSSDDHRTAGKHPAGQPPSALEDVARNVANSTREAASMAKEAAQGAAKNTQQAAQAASAAAQHPAHAAKPAAQGAKTKAPTDAQQAAPARASGP